MNALAFGQSQELNVTAPLSTAAEGAQAPGAEASALAATAPVLAEARKFGADARQARALRDALKSLLLGADEDELVHVLETGGFSEAAARELVAAMTLPQSAAA